LQKLIDLHVIPKVGDETSCRQTGQLLRDAGYDAVALTVPTGVMKERLRELRNQFLDSNIEVFFRVDLNCSNRQELLKLLKRFRNSYDVISVNCSNHALALVAARDRRVDVIFFDPSKRNVWFDHSIANVSHAALEFNLSTMLTEKGPIQKSMKEINIAKEHKVKIVLSSGSTSPLMIRTPSQLSAIGRILGLSRDQARDSVMKIPWLIVKQNVERRSNKYVEEGVTIVRRTS
jgi:RNase P/RNase MRP subunit p30